MKIFILIILVFVTVGNISAGSPGTSGARILGVAVSARSAAMGEAFTALKGIDSLYYNPAGLAGVKDPQITATYLKGLTDTDYAHLSFIYPFMLRDDTDALRTIGTFGLSITKFSGGIIEINYTDGTSKKVTAQQDYVFTLSYGNKFSLFGQSFLAGANIDMLTSELIEKYNASTFCMDAGIIYDIDFADRVLSLGFAVQNLGPEMAYEGEGISGKNGDPLPMAIRFGAGYYIPIEENSVYITTDLVKPNDEDAKVSLGMEYLYKNLFFVRSGYKFGYDLAGFNCGAGIKLAEINIDYALKFMDILKYTHHFSLGIGF